MNLINWKILTRLAILLAAIALTTAGCGTTKPRPVAWNVSITKATPASIEVDLVGVNPSEKPYWMNSVKPDDYWKANSSTRQNAKKVSTSFKDGQTWCLNKSDPIWKVWFSYGSTELMIMANLPGKFPNDAFDRRRLFLSLGKKEWKPAKKETIEVEVQDEFIRVLTPQNLR